jgi:hypothetical protein
MPILSANENPQRTKRDDAADPPIYDVLSSMQELRNTIQGVSLDEITELEANAERLVQYFSSLQSALVNFRAIKHSLAGLHELLASGEDHLNAQFRAFKAHLSAQNGRGLEDTVIVRHRNELFTKESPVPAAAQQSSEAKLRVENESGLAQKASRDDAYHGLANEVDPAAPLKAYVLGEKQFEEREFELGSPINVMTAEPIVDTETSVTPEPAAAEVSSTRLSSSEPESGPQPRQEAPQRDLETISAAVFDRLIETLKEFVGPIAAMLVHDHVAGLGESPTAFPRGRLKELLERVSLEVPDKPRVAFNTQVASELRALNLN